MGIVAGDLGLSPSALDVIYSQLVGAMTHTAVVLCVLGVFIALLGWAMGRSTAARTTRDAVGGLNASARRQLAARGMDTGGFGAWLARYKVLVRTVIAVLAVLWLFALRPLSFGDLVLVIVVAFVVAWLLEILQRRAEERAEAEASEIVDTDDADALVLAGETVAADEVVPAGTPDAAATGAAASAPAKKGPKR